MIRYQCPHCGRRCESADVLRGFPVICLGCRLSIRVPEESTIPDDVPAPSELALGPTKKSLPTSNNSPPATPNRNVVADRALNSSPHVLPTGSRKPPTTLPGPEPAPTISRRPLVLIALTGATLLALAATWFVAFRRSGPADADGQRIETMARIRENFNQQTLLRLAAKHTDWRWDLADKPNLKGKWVVLSVVGLPEPVTFWDRVLATWPGSSRSLEILIDDLWRRGQVDDLTFEATPERWAEGIGETDVVVGIHWWREVIGVYRDGERIALPPGWPQIGDQEPSALRWRAVGYVLDRTNSAIVDVRNFIGKPPAKPPTSSGKPAVGPRPEAEVRDWLKQIVSAFEPAAQP